MKAMVYRIGKERRMKGGDQRKGREGKRDEEDVFFALHDSASIDCKFQS